MSKEVSQRELRSRLPDERISELLDIALEEFTSAGFAGASLTQIARRAGASKTTFYSRFPTKEHLFIAVLERRMNEVFGAMGSSLPTDAAIRTTLTHYAERLASHLSSRKHVALFQLVFTEIRHFPQLAERYYELGAGRSMIILTAYFREQVLLGRMGSHDPATLARDFLNFLTGSLRWVIHGFKREPKRQEILKHAEGAVEVFLRAYGTTSVPSKIL